MSAEHEDKACREARAPLTWTKALAKRMGMW